MISILLKQKYQLLYKLLNYENYKYLSYIRNTKCFTIEIPKLYHYVSRVRGRERDRER